MLPIFQEAKAVGHVMGEGLGRSVIARHRFARTWALGDRKHPLAYTPALVLLEGDEDIDETLAPFRSTSTKDIPSILSMNCLLYTSPSPRDATLSRMPSSA